MSSSAFIFSSPVDVFTVARPVEKAKAGAAPCTPPRAPTSRVPPARPRVQRTIHYAHPGEVQALAALPCFSRASASASAPSTPPLLFVLARLRPLARRARSMFRRRLRHWLPARPAPLNSPVLASPTS
ncbi:hypothetical protein BOTBODRAFT_30117, partial [Botryobasidium botryosum FD-172 SS1]